MSAVTAPLKRTRPHAPERRRPHLEVVEEARPRHTLVYAVTILTVLAAVIFGAVTFNALAASASVAARGLEAEVTAGEREYAQLIADVAALESPARIREEAEALGLVQDGPTRYLPVDRNLPADGAVPPTESHNGGPDPLKPLLSVHP